MIFELRTYQTKSGMRPRFLELFRAKTMPEHARLGMPIIGPFPYVEDSDRFFFMRCFRNMAAREPVKKLFYEGALWREELESVLMPMLERSDVVLVKGAGNLVWTQEDTRK
jgi:hypothetical protein